MKGGFPVEEGVAERLFSVATARRVLSSKKRISGQTAAGLWGGREGSCAAAEARFNFVALTRRSATVIQAASC